MTILVLIGLVAAACTRTEAEPDRGATRQVVGPAAVRLDELPALRPASDSAPRGLRGDWWAVHLPTSDDPARPGVGLVGGVRAVLVDGPGAPLTGDRTYTLHDALSTTTTTPIYKGSSPKVPDDLLRNGGVYQYSVTTSTGQHRGPFSFTVAAANPVGGAYAAAVEPEPFRSGAGEMGIGLSFTTADVGTTAALAAVDGLRDGLPAGWSWNGLGSGISKVVVEDAGGFDGADKVLEIHRDGGEIELLGCVDHDGWGCSVLGGDATGTGLVAAFSDPAAASLTIFDPGTRRTWQVVTWSSRAADDPTDVLHRREGRVASSSAPGAAQVEYAYSSDTGTSIAQVDWQVGGRGDPMTWKVFRSGDAACAGPLPPGFVDVPKGGICGWALPDGDWYRLLYVDAGVPQIGRVVRLPGTSASPKGCAPGDYRSCQDVWDQVSITDWAWSPSLHPVGMREAGVNQSALAGAVDPTDASVTTAVRYDTATGRVAQVQAPAASPGGSRRVADHTYPPPAAAFRGATHQQSVAASASDGSVTAEVSAAALDDGLRRIGTLDPDGSTSVSVWLAGRDLQLARIGSDGTALSQSFDEQDRQVASYDTPASAIDLGRCVAGTTDRSACVPTGGWPEISASLKEYDGDGVPGGLTAEWFNNRVMSGTPVARNAVDRFDSSISALELAPPTDGTLDDGGAVRITGALASGSMPDSLGIEVKGGSTDGGRVFVAGDFYGGIDGASATIDLVEEPQSTPVRFELLLTFTQAPPTALSLADTSAGEDDTYTADTTKQRWGAVTEERSVEAFPAGSSTFATVANRSVYGDVASDGSTSSTTVACGTAPSWEVATATCSGTEIASTRTMEPDGFGGVRPASTTSAEGATTTYEYWGATQTPGSVDGAEGLPAGVAAAPQHGLLRSIHHPDGRVTTSAYDDAGRPVCQRSSDEGSGPWSCAEYDGGGRIVRETFRSAGAPTVTVDYDYAVGTGPAPRTATQTRSEDGTVVSTEKVSLSAAGRVSSYEVRLGGASGAGASSTSAYRYDGLDRPTGTTTTVLVGGASASFETGSSYLPGSGLLDTVTVAGTPAATMRYGAGGLHTGVAYPVAGSMSVALSYDAGMRPSAKTWTLGDGSVVDDVDTVSTGGRVLSTRFDGVDTAYGYDGFGRLVTATSGTVGTAYGWDRDHDLVCTARGLTAPVTSCADAPDHVTNEYSGGRLSATTDAEWALPATAYDDSGNLTGAGDRTFRYDARQQMSAIERAGTTATFERDSSGRVVAQHDEAGTTRLFYAAPDDPTPVAVVSADGGVAFSAPLPGGVVWSTNELIITDHAGNPAIHLTPAGVRQPGRPTQRYGPFGEDLTPAPEPAAPDSSSTTTVAPGATTSTTTTSTTVPGTSTTVPSTSTTASAPADASSADSPGDTTASTTSAAPATTSTSTTPTTTTSTTTSTTSTTSTTTVAPQASEFEPRSWAGRIALDDGVMNLGQRAMLPALGVFTGPDPIPGGSCTVYGYTCADPVNTDDLSGTFSTGAGIAMGIGLLFALIVPGAQMFGGLAAGLFIESLASMALGSLGSFLGVLAETWADKGIHAMLHISWADLGEAALTGLTLGAATAAVGAGLTVLTKFEGPLAVEGMEDYAYGVKVVREGFAGVDEAGTFGSATVYRTYRTMGGLRRIAMRYSATRSASPGFFAWLRRPVVRNAIGIFFVKQGAGAGARYGVHEAHLRWGIFD